VLQVMPEAFACDQGSGEYGAGRCADAAGHHATCVMTFHADRPEARSQEPRGQRVQRKAEKQSDVRAGYFFQPEAEIVPEITSIVRRPLPGRTAARGEDPLPRRVTGAGPCNSGTVGRPVQRVDGENVTGAPADQPA
jgi:hypothetical protein